MSNFKHHLWLFLTLVPQISSAETLWDNWYVVTEKGNPHSYYNEKAELSGAKAKIQVNSWIKLKNKIKNQVRVENLGATAKNTPLLEPLLYNFHAIESGEEVTVDGTISNNGKIFSVKIKRGIEKPKPLRAEMLPKLILASFFPVWIHKNYKRISGVQPIAFQAILEDQVEDQVPVIKGSAYEMRQDEFAKSTGTRKLRIEFAQTVAFWWVTPKGDAVKIEVPALEKSVIKTSKEKAQGFLN